MPARWVVHTVGPVWRGGTAGEAALLASCYRNSFALALEHDVRSIAVPGISTGVYGYPKTEAAQIAVAAMQDFADRFDEIVACCFSADDLKIYQGLLAP